MTDPDGMPPGGEGREVAVPPAATSRAIIGPDIKPVDVNRAAPDDQRLWSVTTIIGVLDKPALVYWAANETAEAAVEDHAIWIPMARKSRPEAKKWLTGARFRPKDGQLLTAADLGTEVHRCLEQVVLTGFWPDDMHGEARPFCDQLDRWLNQFQPEWSASELTVFSPTYGYAGTCDGILTVDGVRCIVDLKTSRKARDAKGNPTTPYPEQVALQLAAYRHAELAAVWRARRHEVQRRRYYLLSEDEKAAAVPVPGVDTGLVLHVTPEHASAWPIDCGTDVHEAFLHTLECARWVQQTSQWVMGDPLTKGA